MAIVGAITAVGAAGYQIYNSEQSKKEAEQGIKDFQRQGLVNPFANIQISTEKSDQQTAANLSRFATSVDALQRGGTRSVLAGIPRLTETNILQQNLISADLDQKSKARDFAIAQGEFRIQGIQENRETQALQGYGQQLQTARQDTTSGILNVVQGGLAINSAIQANKTASTPKVVDFDKFNLKYEPLNVIKKTGPLGFSQSQQQPLFPETPNPFIQIPQQNPLFFDLYQNNQQPLFYNR